MLIWISAVLTIWSMVYYLQKALPEIRANACIDGSLSPMTSDSRGLVRAMPWVFVLIWSTGFVVARFGMPHAPPLGFLAIRYALSVLCFGIWIVLARARLAAQPRASGSTSPWPASLMHAGYLGGVWSAVKAGIGAGTVALLVGLQPVLTAIWLTRGERSGPCQGDGDPVGRPRARPRRPGARRVGQARGRRGDRREPRARDLRVAVDHDRHAVPEALRRAVRRAHRERDPAASRRFVVSLPFALLEPSRSSGIREMVIAMAWSVLVLTLGGSSLLYLLIQRGAATAVTSLMYLVPPCTALMAWLCSARRSRRRC